MGFFVPTCQGPAEAESLWRATRENACLALRANVSDRRIFSARYVVGRRETLATVGGVEVVTGEQVLMIFESDCCFLICTSNWGVDRGTPILTGVPVEVLEFDRGKKATPALSASASRKRTTSRETRPPGLPSAPVVAA